MKEVSLKILDCVIAALIVVGALNWGLVGLFDIDVVALLFGQMSAVSRLIYIIIGLCALYDILSLRAISRRWHVHLNEPDRASQ